MALGHCFNCGRNGVDYICMVCREELGLECCDEHQREHSEPKSALDDEWPAEFDDLADTQEPAE